MKAILKQLHRRKIYKYSLDELKNSSSQKLYKLAKSKIPGGTQLLSKRPEMFAPGIWPSYYSRAKGSKIWDLDGRIFTDMSIMSVGASILGYADPDVDEKVLKAIKDGASSSLNCSEEVLLAEALLDLHPWFDMVRYCRSGGEAISIAIRIARATTNKELILFSGYHGWCDWYLAANLSDQEALDGQLMPGLEPRGVPRSLKGSSIPFMPNSICSLKEKIKGIEDKIAAIIIEPARGIDAPKGYLNELKQLSKDIGSVLIFDEITSGYRMCPGGIHRIYDVKPDIAVFAKSMANGYAMAAIIGTENTMQSFQNTFVSSTNWTERIGPTAALATLNKYLKFSVEEKLINTGNLVKNIWKKNAQKHNLKIDVSGLPSLCSFAFDSKNPIEMNTFFNISMLQTGILGFRQFKPSFAHSEKDLKKYNEAVNLIFGEISKNKNKLKIESDLHHTGFQRLTKE